MKPAPSPNVFLSIATTVAPEITPVLRSASVSHASVISPGVSGIDCGVVVTLYVYFMRSGAAHRRVGTHESRTPPWVSKPAYRRCVGDRRAGSRRMVTRQFVSTTNQPDASRRTSAARSEAHRSSGSRFAVLTAETRSSSEINSLSHRRTIPYRRFRTMLCAAVDVLLISARADHWWSLLTSRVPRRSFQASAPEVPTVDFREGRAVPQ